MSRTLDINSEPLTIEICERVGDQWRILWTWRNELTDSRWPGTMTETEIETRLRELRTPPVVLARAQDGSLIGPDGEVIDG